MSLLDEIPMKSKSDWPSFSKKELRNIIKKCSNPFMLEPDHVSWKHLKVIIKDDKCILNFVNIANACINLSYWPSYFKTLFLIIILKPRKTSYNSPKMFQPIVLLNMLGKLIENVISDRLQNQSITLNFVHPNQMEGL